MKSTSRIVAVLSMVLLVGGLIVATANAQLANQKTYFTFAHEVELPGGVTLPPGKYTFRVADTASGRFIVQILNEDGSKMLASIMTITAPNRLEPSEDSLITFGEASAAAPQPVRYWYYHGQYTGHEFVYPKDEAERIARETRTRVASTETSVTDATSLEEAEVVTVEPSGEVIVESTTQTDIESTTAQDTTTDEQATASVTGTSGQIEQESTVTGASGQIREESQVTRNRTPRNELPRTATFDPLVGMIGLMSLGGFIALRMRTRDTSRSFGDYL